MIDTIRSEWIKFKSVRSTVLLLLAGGLLTVLFAVLIANDVKGDDRVFNLTDISAGSTIAVYLFGALGVQIIGQEYRFNTIRSTFAATPNRTRVLVAKMIVVSVTVAVMALLMQLVCILIGNLMLDPFEIDSTDRGVIVGTIVFAIGWTLVGLGLGAILRQPIAAIILLLVEGAIAENILMSLFSWTSPWLPYANGSQMMFRVGDRHPDDPMFHLRDTGSGGIYFFMVTAAIVALGIVLVNRRDA